MHTRTQALLRMLLRAPCKLPPTALAAADEQGTTALHAAALRGLAGGVEALLRGGACVRARNKWQQVRACGWRARSASQAALRARVVHCVGNVCA